jgi:hypothetical protein
VKSITIGKKDTGVRYDEAGSELADSYFPLWKWESKSPHSICSFLHEGIKSPGEGVEFVSDRMLYLVQMILL